MFLSVTKKRNRALIELAYEWHQAGKIEPDTYLIDYDQVVRNAAMLVKKANTSGVRLYAMTKQFGRNPLLAKAIVEQGFDGVVAVDWREAEVMQRAGVKLGHVGHLVQIPENCLKSVIEVKPQIITVYSEEKVLSVNHAAWSRGVVQPLMLRVTGENDNIYPGQEAGFALEQLASVTELIKGLPAVKLSGVTNFPCFLFAVEQQELLLTENARTLQKAVKILRECGADVTQVNMPSATCVHNLDKIAAAGGTHGEPGHALTGTTPLHAVSEQPELPAMVYVSEISHSVGEKSFCMGGGDYPRSMMRTALVGKAGSDMQETAIQAPDSTAIDYHFALDGKWQVGLTVVAAFRSQVFVTRSKVALARGVGSSKAELIGVFSSGGHLL